MDQKIINSARKLRRALEEFLAVDSASPLSRNVPRRFKSPEELPTECPPDPDEPDESDEPAKPAKPASSSRVRARRKT